MSRTGTPINTEAQNTDENANQLIRENMKCPVCMEVLLPPIYQCETGHNICYTCINHCRTCPLCQGEYGDTRNYFAEELVNSMIITCKYEEYGCKTSCLGRLMKEHQLTCDFQPYRCPVFGCRDVFGICEVNNHMTIKHGFKALKGESHIATIHVQDHHFDKRTEYNPWRISAFGREFYVVAVRSEEGPWYFWAWLLGVAREAVNYSYEIAIFTAEKQALFRGLAQSLRIDQDAVMKSGNCLVLSDSFIKSMRIGDKINLSLRLIEGRDWNSVVKKSVPKKSTKVTPPVEPIPIPIQKKKKNQGTSTSGLKSTTARLPPIPPRPSTPVNGSRSPYVKILPKPTSALPPKDKSPKPKAPPTKDKSPKPKKTLKLKSSQTRSSNSTLARPSSAKSKVSDEENAFVSRMREMLKCPGCGHSITPPIYQCSIGHNLCNLCREGREDCPLCRAPIAMSRNFFAEELLYNTVQRCRYSEGGCQICLAPSQIRSHEMTCDFAPFVCPFSACNQIIEPQNLFSHLQSHQISVVETELSTKIGYPKMRSDSPICSIPNIVMVDGTPFYPLIVRDQDSAWSFWVCSANYTKYKYEFIVRKPSQGRLLSFQGPVLSLRMNQSLVMSNGCALITSDRVMRGFKMNSQIEFSLKIAKVKGKNVSPKTFLTTLDFDMKKLKSPTYSAKTELRASTRTSCLIGLVTSDDDSDVLDLVTEFTHPNNGSSLYSDDFESGSENGRIALEIPSSRGGRDVVPGEESAAQVSRTPNSIALTTSSTAVRDPSRLTDEVYSRRSSGHVSSSRSRSSSESLRSKTPEAIFSYPILPSTDGQTNARDNVRVYNRRQKGSLDKSARSNIWTAKLCGSEQQRPEDVLNFENAPDPVSNSAFVPVDGNNNVSVTHVEIPITQSDAVKEFMEKHCPSGTKLPEIEPAAQEECPVRKGRKSKKSHKVKRNPSNTSSVEEQLTPETITGQTPPASTVEMEDALDASGNQIQRVKKQSRKKKGSKSSNLESESGVKLPTKRQKLRVKFSEIAPEVKEKSVERLSLYGLLTADLAEAKPIKSALKNSCEILAGVQASPSLNMNTSLVKASPESVQIQNVSAVVPIKEEVSIPSMDVEFQPNQNSEDPAPNAQVCDVMESTPSKISHISFKHEDLRDNPQEPVLFDLGDHQPRDIPPTRFDMAIFSNTSLGPRSNDVKHTPSQKLNENFQQTVSEYGIGASGILANNLDIAGYLSDHDDIQSGTQDTEEVDESQAACQVGSSLIKLNPDMYSEDEVIAGDDHVAGTSILDMGQSYEAIAGGISSTIDAVKNIFSGLISGSENENDDESEGELLNGDKFEDGVN